MGEAKNRQKAREAMTEFERLCFDLQRKLANDGHLIRAGWIGLREVWLPQDAPQQQVEDMEAAFMAGALHFYTAIMGTLDEGMEPTAGDMRRMENAHNELMDFEKVLLARLPHYGGKQ
jgi:hypothetical protein